MVWTVTVNKRMLFEVTANTEDEARAYALTVANGNANPSVARYVNFMDKAVTIERCLRGDAHEPEKHLQEK